MSGSNCCFLTCIQISQEADQVVWYSHLFQNFPQFIVIHTVKGFRIVNKAEIDVFLELSWFFYDPVDFGNLISGSSAFSKSKLNIWRFSVHVLLKPDLKNFPQFIVIHTVKGFGIVNKAEIDVFLELSWFFYDPADVGNLISGSSAFSKSSLNIWKFSVHVLLKSPLVNFGHYFAIVWNECNCAVVWTFFGIACLCNWSENWSFPVLCPLLSFPNLLAYWV